FGFLLLRPCLSVILFYTTQAKAGKLHAGSLVSMFICRVNTQGGKDARAHTHTHTHTPHTHTHTHTHTDLFSSMLALHPYCLIDLPLSLTFILSPVTPSLYTHSLNC